MGKTERGEPSKPATTTYADHTTGQTSANANGLPGILADLTPFMGPMQAEQLAQFLRNISRLKRTRSLRRKKQRRSSQSISFRSNLASLANWGGLANLEVLSPLSWGLLLWRQPSHFWRPSLRLARTILPRLARMGRSSPEKEKTRQWKSKCQHKRKRQRKRRRRTLSQKRKRKWRPRMTLRMTQTSKQSRKCLKRRASTPRSHPRSRLACGKPTQDSLRKRKGKRPLRRWTRTHTLVLRT